MNPDLYKIFEIGTKAAVLVYNNWTMVLVFFSTVSYLKNGKTFNYESLRDIFVKHKRTIRKILLKYNNDDFINI